MKNEDYRNNRCSKLETVSIVDFMSIIRRVPFKTFENISDAFETVWNMMISSSDTRRIEIIYDSSLEQSIKN